MEWLAKARDLLVARAKRLIHRVRPMTIALPVVRRSPLVAAFVFPRDKNRYIVPAGYQSDWVTVAPPPQDEK
jgi:hypothetical protein